MITVPGLAHVRESGPLDIISETKGGETSWHHENCFSLLVCMVLIFKCARLEKTRSLELSDFMDTAGSPWPAHQ